MKKKKQRKQVFSTNQVLCWSQQTKKPKPCITTVIEHDGRFRKHEPQRVFFSISRVFSNVHSDLLQCNTRLRLLHLSYDVEVFDQSERTQGPIYIIM